MFPLLSIGPVPELYFILHHQIRNTTVDASRYDFFKDGLNDPEALDFHMSKRMVSQKTSI